VNSPDCRLDHVDRLQKGYEDLHRETPSKDSTCAGSLGIASSPSMPNSLSSIFHKGGYKDSVTFATLKTQAIIAYPRHGDHECQLGRILADHSDLEVKKPSPR